ncbi:tetratricopeptide repeat protein [Chitinophaga sp. LS1]|uniref:tetratricopeptide repeat protein n=1 Tax=Chitinophaga sp. LS1 TaxID=3051176 RepID=UPI002AABB976|nr:tetratricopeptide repeat protein [Chitinophaga sp. LS1]WPV65299.1 tetratricopeptide repeat protein [Chitinophaga sp. LS1]
MKKFIATICCCCALYQSHAQDSVLFKRLARTENWQDIITVTTVPDTLSASALNYLGIAYQMLSQDNMAITIFDKASAKAPKDPRSYYLKGTMLNLRQKYREAIPVFEKAQDCDVSARNYVGLGIAYRGLNKIPQALDMLTKASELPDDDGHANVMIGQIYSEQNDNEKALAVYYKVKDKLAKDGEDYQTACIGICDLEIKEGRHELALPVVQELLEIDTANYIAMTKMVQICYQDKDYITGDRYKAKLYAAQRDGNLDGELNDRFCIDYFKWNKKNVVVYERYEHGTSDKIYNKIIFTIMDHPDSVERTIQTEYALPIEESKPYILCGTDNDGHTNYGLRFDDNTQYEELKTAVLKILDNKKQAVAGSAH